MGRKVVSNNYKIKDKFIKELDEGKGIALLKCEVKGEYNVSNIHDELYAYCATLGGVYNYDFNPQYGKQFSMYIWMPLLIQKYKHNGTITSHIKRVNTKYDILNIIIKDREQMKFENLEKETGELLLLRRIKTDRNNKSLRKLINYCVNTTVRGHNINTTFQLSITSDENSYYLTIHPKYTILSTLSAYELLKNGKYTEKTLLDNLKHKKWSITTKRTGVRLPNMKVKRIISKSEQPVEYDTYLQKINDYYMEQKMPSLKVGLHDDYQYIFITEGGYEYHSENSLVYQGVMRDVKNHIINTKTYDNNINMGKKLAYESGLIESDGQLISNMHDICVDDIKILLNTKEGEKEYNYIELLHLFDWAWNEKSPIYYPCKIAPTIKKLPINIHIFYDFNKIDEKGLDKFKTLLNKIKEEFKQYITIKISEPIKYDFSKAKITDIKHKINENMVDSEINFIYTIMPPILNYEFNSLKSFLFSNGWFHQSMYPNNINNHNNEAYMKSILSQFFHKVGIYLYSLSNTLHPFDYIIGYDITKDKLNGKVRGIGGSAIVYNNKGHALSVIPFSSSHTGSEIANYNILFDALNDQLIKNKDSDLKKILLLKDGVIFDKEVEELKQICENYNFSICYMDIRKNVPIRFFDNSGSSHKNKWSKNNYCSIGDDWYFTSHQYDKYHKKPIKVTGKYLIYKNSEEVVVKQLPIMDSDIKQLIILSKLNFTNSTQPDKTREPCPIHYAHKYVNAVRNNWKMDKKWLEEGCLYFI
jgi:argonaute family protein